MFGNMPFGKQMKLMFGLFCVVFCLACLFLVSVGISNHNTEHNGAFLFAGLVFGALAVYLIYSAIKGKERLSAYQYTQFKETRLFFALKGSCNGYINDLVNDDEIYMYKELCKQFPTLVNQYASEVLNQPMQYSKPVSSTTAAYFGTKIGGVAVGMAAANEAERKRLAYEQNVRDVIASKIAVGSAHDKALNCYNEMVRIIRKNNKANADWSRQEDDIERELREKYKV